MWWPLIAKDHGGVVKILTNRIKAVFRIILTCIDLWYWLVDHGVPSSEMDGQATKLLLNLLNERVLGQVNSSITESSKWRVRNPQSILRLEPVYRPRTS